MEENRAECPNAATVTSLELRGSRWLMSLRFETHRWDNLAVPVRWQKAGTGTVLRPLRELVMITGSVKILIAATLWGIAGGIGGVLISNDWNPVVISLYRSVLTLLFGLVWLAFSRVGDEFREPRLWIWSFLAGLGVSGAFSFYFFGMTHGSVPVAATLLYSAPVFVVVGGILFCHEQITLRSLVALFLVSIGVALLAGVSSHQVAATGVVGTVAGLLSGLCYAIFISAFRNASHYGSAQSVMVVAFAVACVLLFLVAGNSTWVTPIVGREFTQLLALGVLGGGPAFWLYIEGLRDSSARLAAYSGMAEPITASLFGVLVLGQSLSLLQAAGVMIVVITVTTISTSADGS